ncbi:dNA polymerase III epsilon subunit family protein [Mycoplasma sp. CAG:956]|nr:dNA polymerase III epsilon subunit family protein [Mycoplasma sp. CAG:956]
MIEQAGKDLVYVLYEFKKFLGNDIIIGHNVNFDIDFIYDSMVDNLGEYLSNDYIDTLRISRKLLPELKHHKLDNLIDYFNLTKRNEHRALNDCVLTNQVYINLVNFLK